MNDLLFVNLLHMDKLLLMAVMDLMMIMFHEHLMCFKNSCNSLNGIVCHGLVGLMGLTCRLLDPRTLFVPRWILSRKNVLTSIVKINARNYESHTLVWTNRMVEQMETSSNVSWWVCTIPICWVFSLIYWA